jgi:hypothetical protein
MITISDYQALINKCIDAHHFSPVIIDALKLILEGKMTFYFFNELLQERDLNLSDVKEETIETILKYAEMILEDDCLTEYEIQSIRMLRMFLGVEEGEFAKYGYMDRIERMIIDQMEILYADNKINKKEMLHKSDIQGIFGLGYDEYQEIVNKVAIQAYSRGANMQDLDTYL